MIHAASLLSAAAEPICVWKQAQTASAEKAHACRVLGIEIAYLPSLSRKAMECLFVVCLTALALGQILAIRNEKNIKQNKWII
jgi:hypothetical protein